MQYLNALKYLLADSTEQIIFDVGAHHGETEKIFLENFLYSSIYCFEPFDVSFLILKNNASKNTKIYNIGFSDISGKFEFESNFCDPTNSLLPLELNTDKLWGVEGLAQKEKVFCEFITIDEFVSSNQLEKIDLLKLDVQGAEYKVLLGAKKSLENKIIKNIYMEIILAPTYVGQRSFDSYITEMRHFGYDLYGIYNMIYGEFEYLLQVDVIFTLSKGKSIIQL